MAFRKKFVSRKKRTFRKSKRSRVRKFRKALIPANTVKLRGVRPFPDRYMCKLKWLYQTNFSSVTTTPYNVATIRANGPQNALSSGTGENYPIGWNELSQVYGAYRVYGAKIQVRFANATANQETQCHLVATNIESTTYSSIYHLTNEQYTKSCFVSNESPKSLKMYMSTNKIVGKSKRLVSIDNAYGAGVAGLPSELWYYRVLVNPADQTTAVSGTVFIKVTYYIQFDQRKFLAPTG